MLPRRVWPSKGPSAPGIGREPCWPMPQRCSHLPALAYACLPLSYRVRAQSETWTDSLSLGRPGACLLRRPGLPLAYPARPSTDTPTAAPRSCRASCLLRFRCCTSQPLSHPAAGPSCTTTSTLLAVLTQLLAQVHDDPGKLGASALFSGLRKGFRRRLRLRCCQLLFLS